MRSHSDKMALESDTEKVVVQTGFAVSQSRQKPITDVLVWVHCFAKYAAAMAQKFPSCTSGFMSHVLVVLIVRKVCEFGRGAKFDLKSAYRNIPVNPDDRWLLGFVVGWFVVRGYSAAIWLVFGSQNLYIYR